MDSVILATIITAIATVTVGYFTLRATVKASAAKEKIDANAEVLDAWRELNQPLRDENVRLVAERDREREQHLAELAALKAEHQAVLTALGHLNDELGKRKGKQ